MEFCKLEDLCTNIIDCPHSTPNWLDEGIPIIRNYNLNNGKLDFSKASYVDEETYEQRIKRAKPEPGDIIISREAPMGVVAIIPENFKCCLGQRIVLLKVDKTQCKPEYLLYALLSDYVQIQINRVNQTGSIVSNLNIPDLKRLIIPVLKNNQDKVAGILSTINSKIENNNKINVELEAMAKTIYDYWFLQFEFPNEDGKPYKSSGGKMVWNDELKRELPEGWEILRLGDIFNFVKGRIPDELSDLKTEYFNTKYLTIDAANSGKSMYCNCSEMIITNGDVLMVMDGAASGEVYVGNEGAIGSTFCKLKIKKCGIDNELLYFIMKKYENIFKKVNTGSTVPHANKNYINDFKISLPKNINVLKKINKDIVMYTKKIIQNKNENYQLAKLRDFLLPLLMSGQVGFKNSIDNEITHKELEKRELTFV